jgi:hypothetical protein
VNGVDEIEGSYSLREMIDGGRKPLDSDRIEYDSPS